MVLCEGGKRKETGRERSRECDWAGGIGRGRDVGSRVGREERRGGKNRVMEERVSQKERENGS